MLRTQLVLPQLLSCWCQWNSVTVKAGILLKHMASDRGYLDSDPSVLSLSPSALQKWLCLVCREASGGEKCVKLLFEGTRLHMKCVSFQMISEEIVRKELPCRLKIIVERESKILWQILRCSQ